MGNSCGVAAQPQQQQKNDGMPSDFDAYEVGEKEIRAVFDAVFFIFDEDNNGYLTPNQFATLMTSFANDCRPPINIKPAELEKFLRILDKDNSKTVDQKEFVSFFFDLAWITPEDRAAFTQLGPMFEKLATIAEAETERLRRWVYVLHSLFERHFDESKSSKTALPVVGPKELGALIAEGLSLDPETDVPENRPKDDELVRFIKFMDRDGDGYVDEQELIIFSIQGLRQTPEANMAFAARSSMHKKLIHFLNAVNKFAGVKPAVTLSAAPPSAAPPSAALVVSSGPSPLTGVSPPSTAPLQDAGEVKSDELPSSPENVPVASPSETASSSPNQAGGAAPVLEVASEKPTSIPKEQDTPANQVPEPPAAAVTAESKSEEPPQSTRDFEDQKQLEARDAGPTSKESPNRLSHVQHVEELGK